MKPQIGTYYNIMPTAEGDKEATIMIYNYIGEMWNWDPEHGYKQVGTTDIGFVTELNELAKTFSVIHVRINSLGGEIFHGNAIVNAIKNCPAEVHTWNDGVAASMAAMIWMAGKKRHMASNALLMLHSASMICWGNATEMREMADTLDQFDSSLIAGAADSLGVSEEEMRSNYFDGKDHWLTYAQVKELGWASQEDNYPAGDPIPTNKALNYRELMAAYEKNMRAQAAAKNENDKPDPDWIPAPLRKIFEDAKSAIREIIDPSSSSTNLEMNLDEFKKSLADGQLSLEEVQAHLSSIQAPAEQPAAPANNTALDGLIAKLNALEAKNTELEAKVTAFGARPGESRSAPGLPDTDAPGAENVAKTDAQLLEESNNAMRAAALAGDSVQFTPAIKVGS